MALRLVAAISSRFADSLGLPNLIGAKFLVWSGGAKSISRSTSFGELAGLPVHLPSGDFSSCDEGASPVRRRQNPTHSLFPSDQVEGHLCADGVFSEDLSDGISEESEDEEFADAQS